MDRKELFTIPNLISFYRLITFPLVAAFAVMDQEFLFVLFFCINLASDVLDGWIARLFNLKTEFGAKLDSLADVTLYINAVLGAVFFRWDSITPHLWMAGIFIILYLATELYAVIKFKRHASLHLYSSKVGGYLQGIFFFVLFTYGFVGWMFYLALGWGAMSFIEVIICTHMLEHPKSNVKGLYWLRKAT